MSVRYIAKILKQSHPFVHFKKRFQTSILNKLKLSKKKINSDERCGWSKSRETPKLSAPKSTSLGKMANLETKNCL